MGRDVDVVNRLRAKGLKVIEVDGWQSRGSSSFSPLGSVNHHTAGPRRGNAPSLGICINGRSDLPGPLCNALQARDNTIYLIAAGRGNHAGRGGWNGLSGNSSVWGLEVENVGTSAEPWRPDQILTMAKVHAAFIQGSAPAANVCQHKEWTSRKIDAHDINGDEFRRFVEAELAAQVPAPVPVPPEEEEEMASVPAVRLIRCPELGGDEGKKVYLTNGLSRRWIKTPDERDWYMFVFATGNVIDVEQSVLSRIPESA